MSELSHSYRPGDRVRLVNLPERYAAMEGRPGTVGLLYADDDLEVTFDGDDFPTICGHDQLAPLTDSTDE